MSKDPHSSETNQFHAHQALGFAAGPVLPGERQAEFDRLLKDLRAEFEPEGPAQLDCVRTMAAAIWRKQHLDIFARALQARMRYGGYFAYPGDQAGFVEFVKIMLDRATKQTEAALARAQTPAQETYPPESEGTGAGASIGVGAVAGAGARAGEGVGAGADKAKPAAQKTVTDNNASNEGCRIIYTELGSGLRLVEVFEKILGAAKEVFGQPSAMSVANATNEANLQLLAMMGEHVTPERCKAELDLIEELDRTIERSLDRLMKLKRARADSENSRRISPLTPEWAARGCRR